MRISSMTPEEIAAALWPSARRLGHSRDHLEKMRSKYGDKDTLRRLVRELNRRQRVAEREDRERWAAQNAQECRAAFESGVAEEADRVLQERAELTLPERVAVLVARLPAISDGVRGSTFEVKTSGSRTQPLPRLSGPTLQEEVEELLAAAVEGAELLVDRETRALPSNTVDRRNEAIVATPGKAALIAIRFQVSESHVRHLRREAGLNPTTGRALRKREAA